jgi:hypothetical protein
VLLASALLLWCGFWPTIGLEFGQNTISNSLLSWKRYTALSIKSADNLHRKPAFCFDSPNAVHRRDLRLAVSKRFAYAAVSHKEADEVSGSRITFGIIKNALVKIVGPRFTFTANVDPSGNERPKNGLLACSDSFTDLLQADSARFPIRVQPNRFSDLFFGQVNDFAHGIIVTYNSIGRKAEREVEWLPSL